MPLWRRENSAGECQLSTPKSFIYCHRTCFQCGKRTFPDFLRSRMSQLWGSFTWAIVNSKIVNSKNPATQDLFICSRLTGLARFPRSRYATRSFVKVSECSYGRVGWLDRLPRSRVFNPRSREIREIQSEKFVPVIESARSTGLIWRGPQLSLNRKQRHFGRQYDWYTKQSLTVAFAFESCSAIWNLFIKGFKR